MISKRLLRSLPSPIHGRGAFAMESIEAGEAIPLRHKGHGTVDAPSGMNHSCKPNVRNDESDPWVVIALDYICAGDEITVSYNEFAALGWVCNCPSCR